MSVILRKLQQEVFLLDLLEPLPELPALPGFAARLIGDSELEVQVGKDQSINDLFALLSSHNIVVSSMRNKTNRLEELFMRLTRRKDLVGEGEFAL